jgi:cysteine-rich repeat protein
MTVLSSDFEDDDGNFTHSGTLDEWGWGTPSVAPMADCASGSKCWKTDLDGTYDNNCDQTLTSPSIDLSNTTGTVNVTWMQKSNLESGLYDPASATFRETDDSHVKSLWQWSGGTISSNLDTAGWGRHAAAVSGYGGTTAELVFNLPSDFSGSFGGLAIDDVAVTACVYVCGDGDKLGAEGCDDGNTDDGDGCSSTCQIEALAEAGAPDAGVGGGTGNTDAGTTGGSAAMDAATGGSPSAGTGGGGESNAGTAGLPDRPPVEFPNVGGNAGTSGAPAAATSEDSGCGCKVAGGHEEQYPWSPTALGALLVTLMKRRRKGANRSA